MFSMRFYERRRRKATKMNAELDTFPQSLFEQEKDHETKWLSTLARGAKDYSALPFHTLYFFFFVY